MTLLVLPLLKRMRSQSPAFAEVLEPSPFVSPPAAGESSRYDVNMIGAPTVPTALRVPSMVSPGNRLHRLPANFTIQPGWIVSVTPLATAMSFVMMNGTPMFRQTLLALSVPPLIRIPLPGLPVSVNDWSNGDELRS